MLTIRHPADPTDLSSLLVTIERRRTAQGNGENRRQSWPLSQPLMAPHMMPQRAIFPSIAVVDGARFDHYAHWHGGVLDSPRVDAISRPGRCDSSLTTTHDTPAVQQLAPRAPYEPQVDTNGLSPDADSHARQDKQHTPKRDEDKLLSTTTGQHLDVSDPGAHTNDGNPYGALGL
ncbi:hypothetical protein JDV02_008049 [Purpureocillium takamizusanense]|uniref:Uncharacterized protein n=1 Tax=Purpureocillium takamizusanense TaxID=2060973 RepID=A0A9Q8VCX7_9HYPO|nr:uncharacterized protein JDV02_008049 [Purpureocillium takamizusanense]UNI22130.1 hypothetical protein JDV02_008049 [Purpureocillium takamizusanense]